MNVLEVGGGFRCSPAIPAYQPFPLLPFPLWFIPSLVLWFSLFGLWCRSLSGVSLFGVWCSLFGLVPSLVFGLCSLAQTCGKSSNLERAAVGKAAGGKPWKLEKGRKPGKGVGLDRSKGRSGKPGKSGRRGWTLFREVGIRDDANSLLSEHCFQKSHKSPSKFTGPPLAWA